MFIRMTLKLVSGDATAAPIDAITMPRGVLVEWGDCIICAQCVEFPYFEGNLPIADLWLSLEAAEHRWISADVLLAVGLLYSIFPPRCWRGIPVAAQLHLAALWTYFLRLRYGRPHQVIILVEADRQEF